MYAETLTGYTNPALPITNPGFDGTTQCFLGYLSVQTAANPNPRPGGPENSLTRWGDQGPDKILCDYGAVQTFAQFLAGRYGPRFLSALQRDPANGLAGLQDVLDQFRTRQSVSDVIHDWAAMVAVDAALDSGGKLKGGERRERDLQTPTLHASVNWDNPDAYQSPGAPPNGSDYVRLRDASGHYLSADQLSSLSFDGSTSLPIEWAVDPSPPGHPGNPALYSGSGNDLDRAIVRSVTVPSGSPTLTFQTRYNIESGFDYGFVQVSTDGGRTWQSLGNADTTTPPDPTAIQTVQASQPGFTGVADWQAESFSLAPYAGRTILLAFRYVTDPGGEGTDPGQQPGWWIDDVAVGGQPLSDGSTLAGWQSPTQARPSLFGGFTVQLVAYSSNPTRGDKHVYVATLGLDANEDVTLDRKTLKKLIDSRADVVAAIVTFDDPAEASDQYATYRLTANGALQPGGGA